MTEPFFLKKALDFTIPAVGKSVSVVLKGGAIIIASLAVLWAVYCAYIKPNVNPIKTTTQTGNITNINHNYPRASFGCANFRIYERGNSYNHSVGN
jgi:hypothetical protein